VVLFLFVISAAGPGTVVAPAYADPPAADLSSLAYTIETDFGTHIETPSMRLLGYTLDSMIAHPGGDVVVTLYWQALRTMERDWSVFLHLIDQDGIIIAQRDTYPGLGLLPTSRMKQGQTVADRYVIPIPSTSYAPTTLQLVVGLYDFRAKERLLTVGGSDSTELGILAMEALTGDLPNPQSINFHDKVELVGYELDARLVAPGDKILLTLYWRGQRGLDINYSVFAHVRGEGESLWGQHDSWPAGGNAPTVSWIPGEVIKDTHTISLLPGTPPGSYILEIGMYDESGHRLQVINSDRRWTENFVDLSVVRVVDY
jgi:hypothetical protein